MAGMQVNKLQSYVAPQSLTAGTEGKSGKEYCKIVLRNLANSMLPVLHRIGHAIESRFAKGEWMNNAQIAQNLTSEFTRLKSSIATTEGIDQLQGLGKETNMLISVIDLLAKNGAENTDGLKKSLKEFDASINTRINEISNNMKRNAAFEGKADVLAKERVIVKEEEKGNVKKVRKELEGKLGPMHERSGKLNRDERELRKGAPVMSRGKMLESLDQQMRSLVDLASEKGLRKGLGKFMGNISPDNTHLTDLLGLGMHDIQMDPVQRAREILKLVEKGLTNIGIGGIDEGQFKIKSEYKTLNDLHKAVVDSINGLLK